MDPWSEYEDTEIEFDRFSGRFTETGEMIFDEVLQRDSEGRPLGTTMYGRGRLKQTQHRTRKAPNKEFTVDVEKILSVLPLNNTIRKEARPTILKQYLSVEKNFDCRDQIVCRAAAMVYYFFRSHGFYSPFSMAEVAHAANLNDESGLHSAYNSLFCEGSRLARPGPADVRAFADRFLYALNLSRPTMA